MIVLNEMCHEIGKNWKMIEKGSGVSRDHMRRYWTVSFEKCSRWRYGLCLTVDYGHCKNIWDDYQLVGQHPQWIVCWLTNISVQESTLITGNWVQAELNIEFCLLQYLADGDGMWKKNGRDHVNIEAGREWIQTQMIYGLDWKDSLSIEIQMAPFGREANLFFNQ